MMDWAQVLLENVNPAFVLRLQDQRLPQSESAGLSDQLQPQHLWNILIGIIAPLLFVEAIERAPVCINTGALPACTTAPECAQPRHQTHARKMWQSYAAAR